MPDSFTEVSHEGYFSRLGNSIKGIFFGGILFVAAFPVLFLNEGCAVKRYRDLAAGRGAVIEVTADRVDPSNDGKLVYLTGEATTDETLRDDTFDVAAPGIQLRRKAEMFQWKEEKETKTKKKFGGGQETITTFNYEKTWSNSRIDSNKFNEKGRAQHANPADMAVTSNSVRASAVMLGAFKLSNDLVNHISAFQNVPLQDETATKAAAAFQRPVSREGDALYFGKSPGAPQIGDIRVSFSVVPAPQTVSLFAAQQGDSFGAWRAPTGRTLEQSLSMGTVPVDAMFEAKESQRAMITWILRAVGFVIMLAGVAMVLRPLSVLADVIPLFGDIVGAGTGIVAFLVALPFALLTIAVGWLFYRPLIGVPLVVISIGAIVGLIVLLKKKRAQRLSGAGI